jgi:putative ABC transport system ATP-binding protein
MNVTAKKAILVARDLSKVYQMGDVTVNALNRVSLSLFEGEMVVILGASGSGKSTLLNIMGGLDVASSGELFYQEENLSQVAESRLTEFRRNHVGFVFQFYNLIPSLTARENVALVTDIAPNAMKPEEALELVDLHERFDHFPSQLSGGEQQRVAIARAIAKRPQILLCDEPTGALDSTTGKLVLSVIEKVNRDTGTTTAIITHNAAIGSMADTVIKMSSGEVVDTIHNTQRADLDSIEW